MSPELFDSLCGREQGSELLAVVRMAEDDPRRIRVSGDLLVSALDAPANPGNLGTLVRSCDALGCHGVFVGGHATDVYDPATITASRGSIFALPVVRAAGPADLARWLEEVRSMLGGCTVVGADENGNVPLATHDFTAPTLLIFGNETRGLGRSYKELCDTLVRIPMVGSATSLNLAVAASIVLYEVVRQRRASTG